ncbi:MAG: hypothetical protein JJT78_11065, partial [Leptospira sp.]|nr:hypothetical protein [Leptospira sp.]
MVESATKELHNFSLNSEREMSEKLLFDLLRARIEKSKYFGLLSILLTFLFFKTLINWGNFSDT